MKILVTGDRHWAHRGVIRRVLMTHNSYPPPTLIHGACEGADTIAGDIAKSMGWKVVPYPAHWRILGGAAGPSRNQTMVDQKPDLVIAFHDDIDGRSRGTKDCVMKAKVAGIPVVVVTTQP